MLCRPYESRHCTVYTLFCLFLVLVWSDQGNLFYNECYLFSIKTVNFCWVFFFQFVSSWNLTGVNVFFFCQKDTNEHLRCPLYTLRLADPTNVYKSFLDNVQQFRAFTALPVELYVTADETAENFASHCASWHKSCRSKFNKTKLERARKAEKRSHSPDIKERRLSKRQAFDAEK